MRRAVVSIICLLFVLRAAQAADLTVSVTCIEQAPGYDSVVVWFGYSLDTPIHDGGFMYISSSITILPFALEPGSDAYIANAWVIPEETVVFAADGWAGDEYLYGEAWYHPGDDAPECDEQPQVDTPTVDDAGEVNNPTVNERANACYEPGQVCISDEDWKAGWYLIREQYGIGG